MKAPLGWLAEHVALPEGITGRELGEVLIRAGLAAAPLQCDPGTCHTYQNVAFDAANEILTAAADKPAAAVKISFAASKATF